MDLSDSEKEDKSWQESCNIFNQSEQQFLIKTELKQELENKIWQKDCDVFDRVGIQNGQDIFGTLIKQVEENRKSKKPGQEKCSESKKNHIGRTINESPDTSSGESGISSESKEKLPNPKDPKKNLHNRPKKITRNSPNDRTKSPTKSSENVQQNKNCDKINLNKKVLRIRLRRLTNDSSS